MENLSLYRKYRPSNFNEVIDQDYIVTTIKNSILNNKLSHAYLFYGPRGTGKTSMAKLVAKIINCSNLVDFVPCDKCASCVSINDHSNSDVIEMDAASNNGVDEIREIRSKVNLLPNICKYKVYIIDEVHMLSIGAFNALLKTLEEPPSHVIFILATTEINKVPETIVSRCQSFEFKRITDSGIVSRLKYIADCEGLHVDDEVYPLIASYSNGGLRDSINMLDKLCSFSDNVSVSDFYRFKGINDPSVIDDFVNKIISFDLKGVIDYFASFRSSGINYILLINEILLNLRDRVIDVSLSNGDNSVMFEMISNFSSLLRDVKDAVYQNIIFETGVLRFVCRNSIVDKSSLVSVDDKVSDNVVPVSSNASRSTSDVNNIDDSGSNNHDASEIVNNFNSDDDIVSNDVVESSEVSESKIVISRDFIDIRINNCFANADKNVLNSYRNKWSGFGLYVNDPLYASIVSYLVDGSLRVAGDKYAMISVKYASIVNNAMINIDRVEELFLKVIGNKCSLVFVLDSEWDVLKKEYIERIRSGNAYVIIEENVKNDIIDVTTSEAVNSSEIMDDAVSLFGSDVVEIG